MPKKESDLKLLETAVRKWQTRFRLQNWDITVIPVPRESIEGSVAEGEWLYSEAWAHIKLGVPTENFIPDDTGLHETMHVLHAPLSVRYKEMVRKFVPQAVVDRFLAEWDAEEERIVRQLVRGILHKKERLPEGAS